MEDGTTEIVRAVVQASHPTAERSKNPAPLCSDSGITTGTGDDDTPRTRGKQLLVATGKMLSVPVPVKQREELSQKQNP